MSAHQQRIRTGISPPETFRFLAALIVASTMANYVTPASAGGFALQEQSGSGLGRAFAGMAAAGDDISISFYNPAGLTLFDGVESLAISSVISPYGKAKNATATANSVVGGATISGNAPVDIGPTSVIPALYGAWALSPNWRLGLSVNSPWGLSTQHESSWVGRYYAVDSSIATVNVNPTVAYRVGRTLSIGAGLQVQYMRGKLTNATDYGTVGAASGIAAIQAISSPGQQDGFIRMRSEDTSAGYTLGILWQPQPETRVGIGYRSKIDHRLVGDARYTHDGSGVAAALKRATGRFADGGAEASLTTPETVHVGVHHEIDTRWAVSVGAMWTRWQRVKQLLVELDNPSQPSDFTAFNWRNTWAYGIGATFRPSPIWAFRFGASFDGSPVPDSTRGPRIPDNDPAWVALGFDYKPRPGMTLGLNYAHLFISDGDINLSASSRGNAARGNLTTSFQNHVDILAAHLAWRF